MHRLAASVPWSSSAWYLTVPLAALILVLNRRHLPRLRRPAALRLLALAPGLWSWSLGLVSLVLLAAFELTQRVPSVPGEGFGQRLLRRDRQRTVFVVSAGVGLSSLLWLYTLPAPHARLDGFLVTYLPLLALPVLAVALYLRVSTPMLRGKRALLFRRDALRQVSEADKRHVLGRDQEMCVYCHRRVYRASKNPRTCAQFDHVVPHSRGGRSCVENIVTSCAPCNGSKGNRYTLRSRWVARELRRFYATSNGRSVRPLQNS